MTSTYTIPSAASIGHVHLKVSDLERSLNFYCGMLGFQLVTRFGADAAFISAGGYHHHIGLNTWYSKNGSPPPGGSTGLFHIAILYPTRKDLAVIVKRLLQLGHPLTGAADHGVSEAVYLNDPDSNGIELYRDRPREDWPKNSDGSVQMFTKSLDVDDLLTELE